MRKVPRTLSLDLTTVQDDPIAFANARLWVIDGVFRVTTAALDVAAGANPGASIAFTAGTSFGWRYVALHELLVAPSAAGVHGTLTFLGTVVESEEELIAAMYGRQ